MEEFHTIDKFGPKEALILIAKYFYKLDVIRNFNPESVEKKRELLDYGTNSASKQWENAIGIDIIPSPDDSKCFICGLEFKVGGKREWNSPDVEHLLPSALAFLLFGLPGDFHKKWRDNNDKASIIVCDAANEFGNYKGIKLAQLSNYRWCHFHCNNMKSDSVFIEIIKQSNSCLSLNSEICSLRINNTREIIINERVIDNYIDKMKYKGAGSGNSWRIKYKGDYTNIKSNIENSFNMLINILQLFDYSIIKNLIHFNMYIAVCIVHKYLRKPLNMLIVDRIEKLYPLIKQRIYNIPQPKFKREDIMEGGVNHDDEDNILTKEDFEDFLRLGEAIEYYSELPDTPEVPEVPLRINVSQRMNVMNNRPATPRLATPRVATPIRTKRSRNNNVNENQNNMRNENYISKTLALKKPRVTRNFRPNRRPFVPLGQMAGKYKKTRKNRK